MITYTLNELKDGNYDNFMGGSKQTSKKGEIRCTYNRLLELLGTPITEMPESYNEWWFTHGGYPVVIYDRAKVYHFTYKQDEMIEWNIGACTSSMFLVDALTKAIQQNLPIENFLDKDDEDYEKELDEDEN